MSREFEDPRKTDLRLRAEAAIEAAGHDLIPNPVPIDYPEGTNLQGRIKGDIQSVDGAGHTHVFYARPDAQRALPQWLHSTALAAHSLDSVSVHIVTDAAAPELESGARSCGAGWLVVTEDVTLEVRLEPGPPDVGAQRDVVVARIRELRRRLESKTHLNLNANQRRFTEVTDITSGMPFERRESYLKGLEETDRLWREWSDHLSNELDAANVSLDENALDLIERAINAGPAFTDLGDEE